MAIYKRTIWATVFIMASSASGAAMAEGFGAEAGSYMKGYAELSKAGAAWVAAQATVIKAKADADATRAVALQTMEQTRTIAIENDLKAATTFYEKRRLNEAYRMVSVQQRPTKEDLIRYSKAYTPDRPTNYQVDPVRGVVHWPEVFQRDEFLAQRVELDYLFAQRTAARSGLGSENCHQVKEKTEGMHEVLRSIIGEMSPAEYLAARKFVEALAFEAQFAPNVEGVASYQRRGVNRLTE